MKLNKTQIYEQVALGNLNVNDALRLREQIYVQQQASQRSKPDYGKRFTYDEPFLRDHTIMGERVLMGVTHGVLALEAFRTLYPENEKTISHIHKLLFVRPIILYPGENVDVIVKLEEKEERMFFRTEYQKSNQQEYHESASGEFIMGSCPNLPPIDISLFHKQKEKSMSAEQVYRGDHSKAKGHGPSLWIVQKALIRGQEVLGELALNQEIINSTDSYDIHPALLDGAFISSLSAISEELPGLFVPFMIKNIYIFKPFPRNCFCYSKVVKINSEIVEVDIKICDGDGQILVFMQGFMCKRIRSRESFVINKDKSEMNPSSNLLLDAVASVKEGDPVSTGKKPHEIKREIERYLISKITPYTGERNHTLIKNKNIMDLGIDSNNLVALVQEMERELGIELYPTLFFEYPNIARLSEYFDAEYGKVLVKYFHAEVSNGSPEPSLDLQSRQGIFGDSVFSESHHEKSDSKRDETDEEPGSESFKKESHLSLTSANNDIAVIGLAGIFAESPNVTIFWQNLINKKDLIKEIPLDHFDYKPWFEPDMHVEDRMYCKWGSFIPDVDKFDAEFFNVSPREADVMDPQLRILLQVLHATVEDAGYSQRIRGSKTGMYVGVCCHDYQQEMDRCGKPVSPHDGTGNTASMLANRPSFFFDLNGPSFSVDTACSSSLVALHVACKALQRNECEMAFVAGANLLLSSWHYRFFCSMGVLSPTGRCHTFDKDADGYVPGEAIASVLIKPLHKAIEDRDQIHAVIKGTSINHGGYTPSVSAPSSRLEAEVVMAAWKDAGINPETIGYIEAHGTGTRLGDPVEINGLKSAFKMFTRKERFCAVGSAKAHIGHTEGAAGITGVIKVILSMKAKKIPAMPLFKELNPYIQLEGSPLYINREEEHWHKMDNTPRRGGVSSFGFGGAYAHVVLEEYENQNLRPGNKTSAPYLIVLSAKNEERLRSYAGEMVNFLENRGTEGNGSESMNTLADIAYTLQVGREEMEERLAVIVMSVKELIECLKQYCEGVVGIKSFYRGNAGGSVQKQEELIEGNTGESFFRMIISQGDMDKLGQLWVSGTEINWSLLYPNQTPNCISLPTYPFARERYWFEKRHRDNNGVISTDEVLVGETRKPLYFSADNHWSHEVVLHE